MYCRWGPSYQEGRVWDPINRFNPVTFLCLSQARAWISNVIISFSFFQWVKVRGENWLFVLLILVELMAIIT